MDAERFNKRDRRRWIIETKTSKYNDERIPEKFLSWLSLLPSTIFLANTGIKFDSPRSENRLMKFVLTGNRIFSSKLNFDARKWLDIRFLEFKV